MPALYAFAGVWAVGAALSLLSTVLLDPPTAPVEWDEALEMSLGWPWFLGQAFADLIAERWTGAGR